MELLVGLADEGAAHVADICRPAAVQMRKRQALGCGSGHDKRLLRILPAAQFQVELPDLLRRQTTGKRRQVVVARQQRDDGEVTSDADLDVARGPSCSRKLRHHTSGEHLGVPDRQHRSPLALAVVAAACVHLPLRDDADLPGRGLDEGEEENVRVAADDHVRRCDTISPSGMPQHLSDDLVLTLADGVSAAHSDGSALRKRMPPPHAACGIVLQRVGDLQHEGHPWCEHVVG
mmetsp:Transcript_100446/g.288613  ORF Transcript_100446/g.288613 Transcript_100446/m.288613 type:complete len:233 (+) Transcript_100446:1340-2038(+)